LPYLSICQKKVLPEGEKVLIMMEALSTKERFGDWLIILQGMNYGILTSLKNDT
jgi:hypothetical protein